jgi:hypothetical protein
MATITHNQLLTPTEPITNARLNQLAADMVVELEDDEVTAAKIEDGAVVLAKMGADFDDLEDHADDTAAAGGGIAVGALYRTGSTVKVRVA